MRNLVVDPVFVSKHGDSLLRDDAVDALKKRVVPLAALVTPNLHEASGLVGFEVTARRDMQEAATAILDLGAGAVLVKGGHLEGDPVDIFFDGQRTEELGGPRIATRNTHGTGCTLSAAIAAGLALGQEPLEAVQGAKAYLTEALRGAYALGRGAGPVDHLHPLTRRR